MKIVLGQAVELHPVVQGREVQVLGRTARGRTGQALPSDLGAHTVAVDAEHELITDQDLEALAAGVDPLWIDQGDTPELIAMST